MLIPENEIKYEYGIGFVHGNDPLVIHRDHMTKEQAEEWLESWEKVEAMVAFVLIRRPVLAWEVVDDSA